MNDQQKNPHPNASAVKTLWRELWHIVENLGPAPCSSVANLSLDELRGYAMGAEHALVWGLEQLQSNIRTEDDPALQPDASAWVAQIRAAYGEAVRRRTPLKAQCKGRKFNRMLCEIRDWRIALWQGDVTPFDYKAGARVAHCPFSRMRHEIDRLSGCDDDEWGLFMLVQSELSALRGLYDWLNLYDRKWRTKTFTVGSAVTPTDAPLKTQNDNGGVE